MKRFWILLVTIVLLLTCMPSPIRADTVQSGTCGLQGDNLTWTLDSKGTLTISGTGKMHNWVTLEHIMDLSDLNLPPWFNYADSIKEVVIKKGVTVIGSDAFSGCALTEVTIPDTVTVIGDYAFEGCTGLTEIDFPSSVQRIGCGAFGKCSGLTDVTIPDTVQKVDYSAFEDCTGLKKVTVSEHTKGIYSQVFTGCTSLVYNTYDNAKYLGNESNPYAFLIKAKDTSITSCTIHPDTKIIAGNAFVTCSKLSGITIPAKVTEIGDSAFSRCTRLSSITIPGNVKRIGANAFYECTALATLEFETGLEEIGHSAFYNCDKLYRVSLPEGLRTIETQAFYDCDGLNLVGFPDTVTEIGVAIFEGCDKLKYNTYDYGLYLGSNTNLYFLFVKTQYTDIKECKVFPSTKFISGSAFEDCTRLQSVELPKGLLGFQNDAFRNCTSLKEITIPEKVTDIRYTMFANCTALKKVTIPKSVTTINGQAFFGCTALTNVYYGGSKADWEKINKTYGNDVLENATIHFAEHSHEWDAGVITQSATCAKEGVKTFTCTCGETKTQQIDKLTTHTPGAPATATTDQVCTVCGIVLQNATGATDPTVPPTQPPTEEPKPTVPPTQPPTEETVPPMTTPTEPDTEPTEPATAPHTEPTEPTEPSVPEMEATEDTQPMQPPTTVPTEPVEKDENTNEEKDDGALKQTLLMVGFARIANVVIACLMVGGIVIVGILLWKKKK